MSQTERSGPREKAAPDTASPADTVHETDGKAYERGFCDGWRDRAEYARLARLTFDDGLELGFAAGVRAADRAMRNAIAEVTQGMPQDAAAVVRRLVSSWDRWAA